MAKRHVVSSGSGWAVKAPNASRASSKHSTQAEAISAARQVVRNSGGGELVIHGKDGRIRDSDTVSPGRDPFPPRDKK